MKRCKFLSSVSLITIGFATVAQAGNIVCYRASTNLSEAFLGTAQLDMIAMVFNYDDDQIELNSIGNEGAFPVRYCRVDEDDARITVCNLIIFDNIKLDGGEIISEKADITKCGIEEIDADPFLPLSRDLSEVTHLSKCTHTSANTYNYKDLDRLPNHEVEVVEWQSSYYCNGVLP